MPLKNRASNCSLAAVTFLSAVAPAIAFPRFAYAATSCSTATLPLSNSSCV